MTHPVAIIGAGPIGLAAAAHAAERGLDFVVLESGPEAGCRGRRVGPRPPVLRVARARRPGGPAPPRGAGALDARPDADAYPTGGRVARALPAAARRPARRPARRQRPLRRRGHRRGPRGSRPARRLRAREDDPFAVHVETQDGPERLLARAVVDASGTWRQPNPLGADGYPALGEREHADRIAYGIPDLADPDVAARYAGKHVVARRQGCLRPGRAGRADPAGGRPTRRPASRGSCAGPPSATRSAAATTTSSRSVAGSGRPRGPRPRAAWSPTVTRFRTESVRRPARRPADRRVDRRPAGRRRRRGRRRHRLPPRPRLPVRGAAGPRPGAGVAAGARRPDPPRPPQLRRRGTRTGTASWPSPSRVSTWPGMKSYGRAPSFLAMTGFEQVRSVVAALDGDLEAADRVDLVLPETGVCNGAGAFDDPRPSRPCVGGCCGSSPREPRAAHPGPRARGDPQRRPGEPVDDRAALDASGAAAGRRRPQHRPRSCRGAASTTASPPSSPRSPPTPAGPAMAVTGAFSLAAAGQRRRRASGSDGTSTRYGPRAVMTGGSLVAVPGMPTVAAGTVSGRVLRRLGAGRSRDGRDALPAGVRGAHPVGRRAPGAGADDGHARRRAGQHGVRAARRRRRAGWPGWRTAYLVLLAVVAVGHGAAALVGTRPAVATGTRTTPRDGRDRCAAPRARVTPQPGRS